MAQVTLNTRISVETDTKLTEYSKEKNESKASIVERALQAYLMKEEK